MNKNRVKAFTVLEMTIAMLLASIVIGMTYAIYSIVANSYNSFNVKNDKMAEILRVDELLKKDFLSADIILKNESGFLVKRAEQLTNYEIQPDFIIRSSIAIDTFKVKTDSLNMSFQTIPLIEVGEKDEQNRINDIKFFILHENQKIPYNYHKQYSAVNLIQRPNAIN